MPKISFLVRNLVATPGLLTRFESKVTEGSGKVPPGTLIKRGNWHFLTFLRVVKVQNFDATLCEMVDTNSNTVRAVQFQIRQNGLMLIRGSKKEIEEIDNYFGALALEEAGVTSDVAEFDLSKYFQINDPVIDLKSILGKFEAQEIVQNVPKIKVTEIEVSIGTIKKCIINTSDYGGVKKALEGDEVTGIQINLTRPPESSIAYDSMGQISVQTSKESADDLETLMEIGIKLLG